MIGGKSVEVIEQALEPALRLFDLPLELGVGQGSCVEPGIRGSRTSGQLPVHTRAGRGLAWLDAFFSSRTEAGGRLPAEPWQAASTAFAMAHPRVSTKTSAPAAAPNTGITTTNGTAVTS